MHLKKDRLIRILVVDDHTAFRAGLVALIGSQPDMEVVAEAADGLAAVEIFRRTQPDVALMDLRLPGLSGVEAIIAIRKEFPAARVIVITTFDADEDVYRALQSGAKSYLLKDMSKEDIAGTIRAVHRGEQKLPPRVADQLEAHRQRANLTGHETELLRLLTKGRCDEEIATELLIPEHTVKTRLKNLFAKLGVQDRTEAALSAFRHGIVHLE